MEMLLGVYDQIWRLYYKYQAWVEFSIIGLYFQQYIINYFFKYFTQYSDDNNYIIFTQMQKKGATRCYIIEYTCPKMKVFF